MSIRETRRNARAELHRRFRVASYYYATTSPLAERQLVRVRILDRFTKVGDAPGRTPGFAQLQENIPRLIFDASEKVPERGAVVSVSQGEAYRIDNTEPPDDTTVTAFVTLLSASEITALSLEYPQEGDPEVLTEELAVPLSEFSVTPEFQQIQAETNSPIRDVRRVARARLHQRMQIAAYYIESLLTTFSPVLISCRIHTKFDTIDAPQGVPSGFAGSQEPVERIIFPLSVDPKRGGVVSVSEGEAYLIDNTFPPDDTTITAEVTRLSESEAADLPYPADDEVPVDDELPPGFSAATRPFVVWGEDAALENSRVLESSDTVEVDLSQSGVVKFNAPGGKRSRVLELEELCAFDGVTTDFEDVLPSEPNLVPPNGSKLVMGGEGLLQRRKDGSDPEAGQYRLYGSVNRSLRFGVAPQPTDYGSLSYEDL